MDVDGLMDADGELDGLIDALIDGDSDSDGLASETANVPEEVKVCMVLLPLVDMLPPVAVMSPVV